MASLYILIPIALAIVAVAAALFLWASQQQQFDDVESAGQKIMFNEFKDQAAPSPSTKTKKEITT